MANTYQGFSPVDFARAATTTLADHITTLEEAFMRNFQMGALLEAAGRITYNNGGRGFDWPVQYRLHNVEGNTGETVRSFARRNLFKTAQQEYRGYQVQDAMYYREFLENRGPAGVVKVYDNFVQRLETSLKQGLGPEYYVDGSAAANSSSWHGLESMFSILSGVTAQTVDISTGLARTANAADKCGFSQDTYAGINTTLGYYGGDQQTGAIWPEGSADPEYDFWTPLIINYKSSAFSGTADTWAAQGDEAMRYGIAHSQRNTSMDGQLTNIFLARDLWIDLLNRLDNVEQVNITSNYSLRAYGFKNVLQFDGMEVACENAILPTVGYGFNFNNIELRSMDSTLFRPEGPEYEIETQAFVAAVSTLSNLKFSSPRNFVKFDDIA